jgi:hypothetical protein
MHDFREITRGKNNVSFSEDMFIIRTINNIKRLD